MLALSSELISKYKVQPVINNLICSIEVFAFFLILKVVLYILK